jgi:hypothetical protein
MRNAIYAQIYIYLLNNDTPFNKLSYRYDTYVT